MRVSIKADNTGINKPIIELLVGLSLIEIESWHKHSHLLLQWEFLCLNIKGFVAMYLPLHCYSVQTSILINVHSQAALSPEPTQDTDIVGTHTHTSVEN